MSRRTIQSPGVEIREIDLTQRPAAPVGTSVFIAGFANQGPVDEIFNVGTFAEFEEIYGKPTNAAERYFYHSTKQVLIVMRMYLFLGYHMVQPTDNL